MSRAKRISLFIIVLLIGYACAYLGYRNAHIEVWEKDGKPYVIFGSTYTYYLFRPASYIDGSITGMGFHIGPHQ